LWTGALAIGGWTPVAMAIVANVLVSDHQNYVCLEQKTIHPILLVTQLWMNLNGINIWFHLGSPFYKK